MVPLTRRRLLGSAAGVGTAAMAGCFEFGTGCSKWYTLRLTETSDAGIAENEARDPSGLHPVGADLVRTAHDSGAATYRSIRKPPVSERRYVELDGRYYEVTLAVVEEARATGYVFDVTMDEETDEQGPSGASIDYADLPQHDQRAFVAALGYPHERKLDGARSMSGTGPIGYADQSAVESSVLVPDPEYEYVRYQQRYVRLEKIATDEVTVKTFEVRLERVADSAAALAALVREESGVVLRTDELSDEQRDVLRQATGDGYRECVSDSTPTHGLFELLDGASYARYEGTWYDVDLVEAVT